MNDSVSIYMNYFPLMSNIMSYYQNIGIMLMTATAILMFSLKKEKCNCLIGFTWVFSALSGFFSVIYLILGFITYENIVKSFFRLTTSLERFDNNLVTENLNLQSWIGLFSGIFLILSFILYLIGHTRKKK